MYFLQTTRLLVLTSQVQMTSIKRQWAHSPSPSASRAFRTSLFPGCFSLGSRRQVLGRTLEVKDSWGALPRRVETVYWVLRTKYLKDVIWLDLRSTEDYSCSSMFYFPLSSVVCRRSLEALVVPEIECELES